MRQLSESLQKMIDDAKITKKQADLYQYRANCIARKAGYNRATIVKFGRSDKVINVVDFGYRKHSNDEYVSNAYRNNFGWKNTYYQSAEITVQVKKIKWVFDQFCMGAALFKTSVAKYTNELGEIKLVVEKNGKAGSERIFDNENDYYQFYDNAVSEEDHLFNQVRGLSSLIGHMTNGGDL